MERESVMAKKSKQKSPFEGRWRITRMDQWDQDYVDEEVEGYFEFGTGGLGSFQFGYVQGQIDYRTTSREGKASGRVFLGGRRWADGTPLTGRGWAVLETEELSGLSCIHLGDESEFRAERAKRS